MGVTLDLGRSWAAIGVLAVAIALGACPGDDSATQGEGGSAGSGFSVPSLPGWRALQPPDPVLPACVPGACDRNSDCDDGLYCTGVERCDPGDDAADACGCVQPRHSPCGGDYICDEVARACWPPPQTGPCTACTANDDCSDGMFCNGVELCAPRAATADSCGCIHAARTACTRDQICHEEMASCETACEFELDEDGDGATNILCGGTDCDDTDGARYPGAPEICDTGDHDEDCVADTFGFRDADADGYADARCCNDVGGGDPICGDDCDDGHGGVHPGEAESCDGVDTDCDGAIDETVSMLLYADEDGDGYGVGSAEPGCVGITNTSTRGGDCDDANPALRPGAMRCGGSAANAIEICDLDGTWAADSCGTNGQAQPIQCVVQPNGTGHCQQ